MAHSAPRLKSRDEGGGLALFSLGGKTSVDANCNTLSNGAFPTLVFGEAVGGYPNSEPVGSGWPDGNGGWIVKGQSGQTVSAQVLCYQSQLDGPVTQWFHTVTATKISSTQTRASCGTGEVLVAGWTVGNPSGLKEWPNYSGTNTWTAEPASAPAAAECATASEVTQTGVTVKPTAGHWFLNNPTNGFLGCTQDNDGDIDEIGGTMGSPGYPGPAGDQYFGYNPNNDTQPPSVTKPTGMWWWTNNTTNKAQFIAYIICQD
jgi:hypothetical protein